MVKKTVLDCGLTVISEYYPDSPSAALSYTLKKGSRNEDRQDCGLFHFIEHMLFKGGAKYDYKAIAAISDRLGGQLNAFTGKEMTQYYLKVVRDKADQAFDLLSEIVFKSSFPADELEKERGVIIQEVRETLDNPDHYAFDLFYEKAFPGSGLALPIGGYEDTVAQLGHERIHSLYREIYHPANFVLASAGALGHEELLGLASGFFRGFPGREPHPFYYRGFNWQAIQEMKPNPSLQQAYVIIAFPGLAGASPEREAFMVLNDALGGGMSSRLFQSIREEKGLAYTINSFHESYFESGVHLVFAVIEPRQIAEYLAAVRAEVELFRDQGLSGEELARSKDHIRASVVLGLESNLARMRYLVNHELYHGAEIPLDELLGRVDAVSLEQLGELARHTLDIPRSSVYVYGNIT